MFGAYSCRSIDNIDGARLSEHAFGNAVDVAGFTLADGRTLQFVRDWKKADTQEAAFLHEVHAGACQYFNTVLGPGADVFHYNHIHLDLANHGATNTGPRRICRPTPAPNLLPPPAVPDGLPPAPEIEEPLDIAHLRGAERRRSRRRLPWPSRARGQTAPCRRQRSVKPTPRRRSCPPAPDRASIRSRHRRPGSTTIRQGLETLPLRIQRQFDNAAKVANFLAGHQKVAKVVYPGLQTGLDRERADKYLKNGYGGLVGF